MARISPVSAACSGYFPLSGPRRCGDRAAQACGGRRRWRWPSCAPLLPALANIGDGGGALAIIGAGVVRLFGAAALALLAIAVIDGGISFVLRERKLRMTLDEVKREIARK